MVVGPGTVVEVAAAFADSAAVTYAEVSLILALAHLRGRDIRDIEARKETVMSKPGGRVTFVDYNTGTVRVNVNRAQGVRNLMRFTIFDKNAVGITSDRPKAAIEGRITRVDTTDPMLVQVSIGSDHGLTVDNTLDVYRENPAIYLGRLRIVDTYHHSAIGRLIPSSAARTRTPVQVGDVVSSKLSTRQ